MAGEVATSFLVEGSKGSRCLVNIQIGCLSLRVRTMLAEGDTSQPLHGSRCGMVLANGWGSTVKRDLVYCQTWSTFRTTPCTPNHNSTNKLREHETFLSYLTVDMNDS